jgi:hypothetical protein
MEAKARRERLLLAALVVVLGAVLWWRFGSDADTPSPAFERPRASVPASRGGRDTASAIVEPVALSELRAPSPRPAEMGRNPFRFQPREAPSSPDDASSRSRAGNAQAEPPVLPSPTGPPQPPPIPLRFIGTVDEVGRHLKLAVLSDGRNVFYGREGDVIEGRYRIVHIGVESIEMTHVDGRGQQTIRLSGS